jgi:DNA-binding transcriptional LysR family regulator
MEDALGARLFDRTPGGLLPTPALERVLPWAEQAMDALAQMKGELAGLERVPEGVVRVAVLPGVSRFLLAPALPRLLARHPGLAIELLPASAVVDLTRREADLAIRTVRPESGDLVIQRLATFRIAFMAAPELLGSRRKVALSQLPWLDFAEEMSGTPESTWRRAQVPVARVVLRSPDVETLIGAARAGLGALAVAQPLGMAAGGLVELPTAAPSPEGALWLVAHRALRHVPRVAVVWDWVARTLDEAGSRIRDR